MVIVHRRWRLKINQVGIYNKSSGTVIDVQLLRTRLWMTTRVREVRQKYSLSEIWMGGDCLWICWSALLMQHKLLKHQPFGSVRVSVFISATQIGICRWSVIWPLNVNITRDEFFLVRYVEDSIVHGMFQFNNIYCTLA